ncbi:MAG: hypothetical protein ACRAS9_00830 [Mycoplasma sp.]
MLVLSNVMDSIGRCLENVPIWFWMLILTIASLAILLTIIALAIKSGSNKGIKTINGELDVEKHQLLKSGIIPSEKEKIALLQMSTFYFSKSLLTAIFFIGKRLTLISVFLFLLALLLATCGILYFNI